MKKKADSYNWKYCSIGGSPRIAITTGSDIEHLGELDEKLWTVLSMPVKGLEFDAKTLEILDSDADGKIRVDEIKAAAKWLTSVVKDSNKIVNGEDCLALDAINAETEEGAKALEAAKLVLSDLAKEEAVISMADLAACSAAFDEKCKAAAEAAAAAAAAAALPYGDKTDAAIAACDALKSKIADYFMRCKLISFDEAAADTLDVSVDKIGEISALNLADEAAKIADFPIARPVKSATLSFDGINPAWAATFAAIKDSALDADFPGAASIDEAQWNSVVAKLEDYKALKQSKLTEGADVLDKEGQDKKAAIESTAKMLHLYRDFYRILQNYVVLSDFYAPDRKAIFQAGRLVIDQRCCELCVKVSDMGKHGDMAGLSGMFLIYCNCTSKKGAAPMDIVAVMTAGNVRGLRVGKNGLFYDRAGNDWDATITKIIDNPISIAQAFWSPYRKFGNWCTEKVNKMANDSEAKATAKLTANAETASAQASTDLAAGEKKAAVPAFDIAKFAGIFAAIGLALGYIGGFILKLGKAYVSLPWWGMILVIVALFLLISGPSMFIAWGKLRKRDLGPVLNANGWAINAGALVNTSFGKTLTNLAKYPVVKSKDPYAKKSCGWLWIILVLAVAAAAAYFYCRG